MDPHVKEWFEASFCSFYGRFWKFIYKFDKNQLYLSKHKSLQLQLTFNQNWFYKINLTQNQTHSFVSFVLGGGGIWVKAPCKRREKMKKNRGQKITTWLLPVSFCVAHKIWLTQHRWSISILNFHTDGTSAWDFSKHVFTYSTIVASFGDHHCFSCSPHTKPLGKFTYKKLQLNSTIKDIRISIHFNKDIGIVHQHGFFLFPKSTKMPWKRKGKKKEEGKTESR